MRVSVCGQCPCFMGQCGELWAGRKGWAAGQHCLHVAVSLKGCHSPRDVLVPTWAHSDAVGSSQSQAAAKLRGLTVPDHTAQPWGQEAKGCVPACSSAQGPALVLSEKPFDSVEVLMPVREYETQGPAISCRSSKVWCSMKVPCRFLQHRTLSMADWELAEWVETSGYQ